MQALQLVAPHQVELRTIPDPPDPGPGEVVVRLRACGICGSDMHYYLEDNCAGTPAKYPSVLGHEPAGEIAAMGAGVAGLAVGDRVAVEPAVCCGHCEFCLSGKRNLCENVRFMGGVQLPGLMREFAVMPAHNVLKVPAEMDFVTATAIEPVAVLLHALNLAKLRVGETVAVMGAGPIGILAVQLAKLAGASTVVCADRVEHRLKRAKELGADVVVNVDKQSVADAVFDLTHHKGAHVVIDAAGKPASINAGIASARHAGRIVIVGIPSQAETPVHLWEAGHRELTITVQKRSNGNDHDALQLLMSGKIDPASFISHRFPMERGADAFKTMGAYADGVIKPVVEF